MDETMAVGTRNCVRSNGGGVDGVVEDAHFEGNLFDGEDLKYKSSINLNKFK